MSSKQFACIAKERHKNLQSHPVCKPQLLTHFSCSDQKYLAAIMTIEWNPRPHVQHAWADAQTVYGKISLVLFYTLIWLLIVMSAWQLIFPYSMGAKCWCTDGIWKKDQNAQALMVAVGRGGNVVWLGFLSYADVGGFKIKNITMVTIVVTVYTLCFVPVVKLGQELGCTASLWMMLIFPAWAILALLFALVDDKMADRGTREENRSLTV